MNTKKLIIVANIFFLFCSNTNFAQKKLTIESIWKKFEFREAGIDEIKMRNDGKHFTIIENIEGNQAVTEYDLISGKQTAVLYNPAALHTAEYKGPSTFADYDFNNNETKLIIGSDVEHIYRRSAIGEYFIYDLQEKKAQKLSTKGKQKYPLLSPDGTMCAFVRDNNIWIKNLNSEKEYAITNDGKINAIINGSSDWVYEEEFELTRAFEWSNDSKNIAFIKFDETNVPEFTYEKYTNAVYPIYETFKYPKAGAANSNVSVHVYNVQSNQTKNIALPKPAIDEEQYIPRIQFTANANELCVTRINRHQNHLELITYNCENEKTSKLYEETNPNYIEINKDIYFTKDGKYFIWLSEKNGFNHIYKVDIKNNITQNITDGNWDVTEFYGYDEINDKYYYQSTEKNATERHIYSIDGKQNKKQLSKSIGTHQATFSPNYSYYINEFSSAKTPSQYSICDNNGKPLRTLEDNADYEKKVKEFPFQEKEFITITTAETTLNAWIIKPSNFNPNNKYPVLFDIYGGPGHNTVNNAWESVNYIWHQYMAQEGFIIVSVDNRGTLGRGEKFKKCTYLQLGKLESDDQIAAAKYFQTLPFVDANRIGVFGWSYGGYMSSILITKGADVFKAAVAVAPVTNWKFYDSIYTERFMRSPEENKEGYENNAPMFYAEKLKGKYLLIHGLADDNVHVQNSWEMVSALNKAGKDFEMFMYPNKNHGIYGGNTRYILFNKISDFFKHNL